MNISLLVLLLTLTWCSDSFQNGRFDIFARSHWLKPHARKPFDALQQQLAPNCFIDYVSLENWGLFDNATVRFYSQPQFFAITGETGSGKSVFISALEYMCARSHRMRLNGQSDRAAGISKVTVTLDDSLTAVRATTSGKHFSKTYSLASKKTASEIDGERCTVKQLSTVLGRLVRFWSPDSVRVLDSNDFRYYVDLHRQLDVDRLLPLVASSYEQWSAASQHLDHLLQLQERVEYGDTELLIAANLDDVNKLEARLKTALQDSLIVFDDLSQQDEVMSRDVVAADASPLVGARQAVRQALYDGDKLVLDLNDGYEALLSAEAALKKFQVIVSRSLLTSATRPRGRLSAASMTEGSGSKVSLTELRLSLSGYSDSIANTLKELTAFGVDTSALEMQLREAVSLLQECASQIDEAEDLVAGAAAVVPTTVDGLLEKVAQIKSDWNMLARKHRTPPEQLQQLRREWTRELAMYSNLSVSLPAQQLQEARCREQYCGLATKLSVLRLWSSRDLVGKVNEVLPQLEMSDKVAQITVRSVVPGLDAFLQQSSSSHAQDNLAAVAANITNSAAFQTFVMQCSLRRLTALGFARLDSGWDETLLSAVDGWRLGGAAATTADNLRYICLLDDSYNSSTSDTLPLSATISSGECARMALAVETACHSHVTDGQNTNNVDAGSDDKFTMAQSYDETTAVESLLVFDEIDAHVGGEAAVAVARLLKRLGRTFQIVAITHNPVIAAAADRHLVVTRHLSASSIAGENEQQLQLRNSKSKFGAATSQQKSQIVEADTYAQRAAELARMATGLLNTTAGQDLARALLSVNFDG